MNTQSLRPQDMDFLERRQRLLRRWPIVAILMLLGLVGVASWIYITQPLLIDPLTLSRALEAGSLDDSTIVLMALFTPVLMLMLFVVVTVMIFYGFVFFNHEGRYQALIAALLNAGSTVSDAD